MKRSDFLKSLAFIPLTSIAMKLSALEKLSDTFSNSPRMPVLFLGHGSPMNAIEENEFVNGFREQAKNLPKPNAILCISAHWETNGTFVTAMEKPRTIHDFGGFPKALFDVQYPAPGNPDLAEAVKDMISDTDIGLDHDWGLDHGAWSVIKHLYPNADIPVLQLSIDRRRNANFHYKLAGELSKLREKGILIFGSGNMVHNLSMVAWNKLNEPFAFDWAEEASSRMKDAIITDDHQTLINYDKQGRAFNLAIPTNEHYIPLIYTMGLKSNTDSVFLFNDRPVAGSLTMTSVRIS
jgi:4,5-DOPA dioxygenase extradiol